MATAGDLYVEWLGPEAVALNRATGELHHLNPPAAALLAFVQEHGLEAGAAAAADHFGLPRDAVEIRDLLDDMSVRGIVAPARPAREEPNSREPRAPAG